jgi:LysM repeat protein
VADQPVQSQFPDAPPLPDSDFEPEPKRPRASNSGGKSSPLQWALVAIVVLLLAASAGLVLAWVVAAMHAVPAPVGALATDTPAPGDSAGPGQPTPVGTDQPRHTPTPAPSQTQEPPPFVHIVQRGEYLSYIAALYGVSVEDIIALNDIQNPNSIRVGRELLIPGYGHAPPPSPTPKPRKTPKP